MEDLYTKVREAQAKTIRLGEVAEAAGALYAQIGSPRHRKEYGEALKAWVEASRESRFLSEQWMALLDSVIQEKWQRQQLGGADKPAEG